MPDYEARDMTHSPATVYSSEIQCVDSVFENTVVSSQCSKTCLSHMKTEPSGNEEEKPVDLCETDIDSRYGNTSQSFEISMCAISADVKSSSETSLLSSDNCEQAMSDEDSEPLNSDHRLKPLDSQTGIIRPLASEDTTNTPKCQCDESNDCLSYSNCDEELETAECIDYARAKSLISCSNFDDKVQIPKLSTDSVIETSNKISYDNQQSSTTETRKHVLGSSMDCSLTARNHFDHHSGIETNNSTDNSRNNVDVSIQRYLSSDNSADHCTTVVYPDGDCNLISDNATQSGHGDDSYLSSDIENHHSELTTQNLQPSHSVDHYESSQISEICNNGFDSNFLNRNEDTLDDITKESNYSTEAASHKTIYSVNDISGEELAYKQSLEEYKVTENDEYIPFVQNNKYQHISTAETDSSYKQTADSLDTMLRYKRAITDKDVSSYRQHQTEDAEEMETELIDEDEVSCSSVSPSIYQSYEEDSMAEHYQTAAIGELTKMSTVSQYGTNNGPAWNPASSSNGKTDGAVLCSSQITNSETCATTQNTVTNTATSTKDQAATSTSSPVSSSSSPVWPVREDDHKAALCTGDQTFKSAAARQSAMVPFMSVGCSLPYVSGINPSMYTGPAMVQGMGGPTVMTSASVHIAQHPGGATIMRQQSMSTGLSGGMSQATVMQRQAMSNGLQATAMMQHRTLTSGGQTMVVQQRTMTTGLGGLARQTVVQQRVAAPCNISHAAMFQANAMRHRALVTQQANVMQQRGIRLIPARLMGSPLMQSQTLGGPTLIRGGPANPAAFLGQGLVRGVNQGALMQQLMQQRYGGGPIFPGRGMQVVASRPIRLVNK